MAYSSRSQRKPIERASKISHSEIINNRQVKGLLGRCSLPAVPEPGDDFGPIALPENPSTTARTVIAVDGGFKETFVRDAYPSATVTFFAFGPLMLQIADLRVMDDKPFIEPEDLRKLKNIERFTLALPSCGVVLEGEPGLASSFRRALHEYLEQLRPGDTSLDDTLRWLLFRRWDPSWNEAWQVPACPNGCGAGGIDFVPNGPSQTVCPVCGGPVYLSDALRLYERIDDEQGAGAVTSYVMTTLEQLVVVHMVKTVLAIKRGLLSEILFIKDGPLAFFGVTAPLRKPMQELCAYFDGAGERPLLRVVGVEKSGAFVDHALAIESRLPENSFLPLRNDYIYRYIIPGAGTEEYGFNTYYGRKLIFKSAGGEVYVVTMPIRGDWVDDDVVRDEVAEPLAVLGLLRCAMYENALLPVALANKLVSLSDYPSTRILTAFARDEVAG